MNLVDTLDQIWTQILDVLSLFIMPDWGSVIGLIPVLVVLGLVGPFLTFLALGTLIYLVRKPRVKMTYQEGPRAAEIGPGGDPVFPVGLPYCRRDALVYPQRDPALRGLQGRAGGHLPDVRPGPLRADRHVLQLRAGPEGQDR